MLIAYTRRIKRELYAERECGKAAKKKEDRDSGRDTGLLEFFGCQGHSSSKVVSLYTVPRLTQTPSIRPLILSCLYIFNIP